MTEPKRIQMTRSMVSSTWVGGQSRRHNRCRLPMTQSDRYAWSLAIWMATWIGWSARLGLRFTPIETVVTVGSMTPSIPRSRYSPKPGD